MKKYLLISLLLFLVSPAFAQIDSLHTLRGNVIDNLGEPIIGCYVGIKDNRLRYTMCDLDGNYTINVRIGEVIEFSFIGYKKKDTKYNGEERIDVALEEDCLELGDPVFYFKSTNMYDVSTSLSRNDYVVDIGQDMQKGLFSGLHLQTSANIFEPNINIRSGIGGIGGETKFVVDDIIDAPFHFSDLQSALPLRDAASAIVYGSATAPGGVINIKTERGNLDSRYISANIRSGIQNTGLLLPHNDRERYKSNLRAALVQHYDLKFENYFRSQHGALNASAFVSYDNIEGVIKDSDGERFTSRLKLKYIKNSWLNLSQTIYYDKQRQDNRWLFLSEADSEQKVNIGKIDTNPRYEFFSATSAKLSPWKWMNVKSIISYDRINNKGNRADDNLYMTDFRDYFSFRNQENSRNSRWAWNNQINTSFNFDSWTTLDINGAFDRELIKLNTYSGAKEWNRSNAVNNILLSSTFNKDRGRYTASASIRRLTSSTLGKADVYLPTVSVGWLFMDRNRGKCYPVKQAEGRLKASWSKTAHTGALIPTMTIDSYAYPDFSLSNLRWQITEQANVGLDFTFLDHELKFSAMYFHKKTNHIQEYSLLPSGAMQITSGNGKIVNSGVELNTSYNVRIFREWWNFMGHFTYNDSSVKNSPTNAQLILGDFIAPKYTYGAGTKFKLELFRKWFHFGLFFEGKSNLKMMSHPFLQPDQIDYININYFALKSLDISYLYNLYIKKKRIGLDFCLNAENLFYFANSSLKQVEQSNCVYYPINRMISLGVKIRL